jgi:hypothetical protein
VVLAVYQVWQSGLPMRQTDTVRGVVTAVDGPTVAQVTSFTLRTADGQVLGFEVETLSLTGGGKPAPHLREHLVSGEPVEVEFYRAGQRHIAVRYRDAD